MMASAIKQDGEVFVANYDKIITKNIYQNG